MKLNALQHNKGIILGFLSTALGAMITIFYKPMMDNGMPAISIALIESCVIAIILMAICRPWRLLRTKRRIWQPILISSLCQAVGGISYFFGLSHVDPVTFSFLTRNQAIVGILFGLIFLNERNNFITWLFIVLAVIGSFMLCYADSNAMNPAGIFFAIIFCVSFGIRNFTLRKYPCLPALINLFYGYLLSIVLLLFLAAISSSYDFPAVSLYDLTKISLISIVASFGTLYLFQLALRYESISIISPIRLFSPYMVAIYFGWGIGYDYSTSKIMGMLFMTMAIITLIYSSRVKYNAQVKLVRGIA